MNTPRKSVDQPQTNDLSASTILDLPSTNSTGNNNYLNNRLDSPATLPVSECTQNPLESSLNKLDLQTRSSSQPVTTKPPIPQMSQIQRFQNDSLTSSTPTTRSNIYYNCAHCGYRFVFNDLENKIVTCPNCEQVSAISENYKKTNGIIFLLMFFIYLIFGIDYAKDVNRSSSVLYYLLIIGFLIASIFCLWKSYNFFKIKLSSISMSSA